MSTTFKLLATAAIVLVAAGVFGWKYQDYLVNPWTRDGQVRAQVIEITPRVSGPIIDLPIVDNQFVKKGDLLFSIDPRTFAAAAAQQQANLDRTLDDLGALDQSVESAKAAVRQYEAQIVAAEATIQRTEAEVERTTVDVERATVLLKKGDVSKRRYDQAIADKEAAISAQNNAIANVNQARAQKLKAEAELARARASRGASGDENAQIRAARAAVEQATLNLEFTQVRAPVDGYVTNLNLRLGSQGVANKAALALVDVNSFWVHGFFRETFIGDISAGDQAVITLMSYPDTPLTGRVDSIGWGIAQEDGSTGANLLPNVNPTFQWIRLAERVPVRVHLENVPEGVDLRVGTTASVMVRTGTAGSEATGEPVAVPKVLQ